MGHFPLCGLHAEGRTGQSPHKPDIAATVSLHTFDPSVSSEAIPMAFGRLIGAAGVSSA